MASQRLDEWLSEAYDLELPVARSYILQGLVSLNGSPVHQAGRRIRPDRDDIQFRKPADYRNRGTAKIRTALHRLRDCGVEFAEQTCLDIGASHGGFTAALLEQGVGHVYAIDVAYGIFDFDQENFYWNFARGKMLYQLGVAQYERFKQAYIHENRYIIEQHLNLTSQEKQKVYDFLLWNSQPENKMYNYNYVYDNCSSKVPEILDKIFVTS